jgi:membrane-bound ClpP family serine protease
MEWFIVLFLISLGLLLLVVEVIFIPGTSVAGFIGFGLMITGAVLSFKYFDDQTGWIVVASSGAVSAVVFIWVFRAKPWKQFALKSTSSSKLNEGQFVGLTEGTEGVAISMLRPRGNANFSDKTVEVSSLGNFIEAGTQIKIVKISSSQIFVEPLN